MGIQPVLQPAAVWCLCQQHVLHQRVIQPRVAAPVRLPAPCMLLGLQTLHQHFAQHAAQGIAAARPLHGTCIGQVFALARDSCLEQTPAQKAHKACCHHRIAKPPGQCAALAQVFAKVVDQLQTADHASQPHVQHGVAFLEV